MIRINAIPPIMNPTQSLKPEAETPAATAKQFGEFLAEAMAKVEAAQSEATQAAQKLATGEIRDVAEVMIASEKATLALQMTIQVRNKVLEAYQEIIRMPV